MTILTKKQIEEIRLHRLSLTGSFDVCQTAIVLHDKLEKAEAELADCDKKYKHIASLNAEFKQIIAHQNDNECEHEIAEAKPYMDAIRNRHNGYDPEYRKETGETEPKNPKAALDQLVGEATALGLIESKLWKQELAELREMVAWYFECEGFFSWATIQNGDHEIWKEIHKTRYYAEQALRTAGGNDG